MARPSLLLLIALLPAAALGKDCGRLPRGKNPSMRELDAEITKLSTKHSVPTEVIKAISYQESRCQQWRSDGTFVYNKTDCGLGMMQLTGSTAKQFDVERLKDDWKYNLDCGVQVLVQKWMRAQRQGKAPADPGARRVLENWYYPIAYYWGGKTERYLKKIFGHMEKRPGRLAQLLGRSVKVTLASEAIPGFKFGDKFVALPKHRFQDQAGKLHQAPTHLGTIGDAKTLAKLDVWLARGKKYAAKGKVRLAVKYLTRVTAADYDTGHKREARALLKSIVAAAEALVKLAEQKAKAGEVDVALKLLRKVARDHKGLPIAETARHEVTRLEAAEKERAGK